MSMVPFLSYKDLAQYSHVNRHAQVNYTNLLQKYADYMDETTKWDHSGKVITYRTPPSDSRQFILEAIEDAPNCE